jgi:hypothetical protein
MMAPSKNGVVKRFSLGWREIAKASRQNNAHSFGKVQSKGTCGMMKFKIDITKQ